MMHFLAVRVLHILLAALWFGATVATTFYFVPAMKAVPAAGGQVMIGVIKRGYSTMLSVVAGLVMLTGLDLYYRVTQGFDPVISGSMMGRVFGVGAVAGIIATVLGSMAGASARRLSIIMQKAGPMSDGAEKAALVQQAGALQQRLGTFSLITLVLMVIAIVTMSIGHYVG